MKDQKYWVITLLKKVYRGLATSTQHLIKCIKYFTLKFILRYLYLIRNLADIGFRLTLTNWLYLNTYFWLVLLSPQKATNAAIRLNVLVFGGLWIIKEANNRYFDRAN